jgi:hypothetical protein
VTAMKLTPNAAMRARDVSRPRAEHLAEAEAAEVRGNTGREGTGREGTGREGTGREGTGRAETGSVETGGAPAGVTGGDLAARPGFPRRRRGPRDGGRRGRSSR